MPAAARDMRIKMHRDMKGMFRNNRMLPIRHESDIIVSIKDDF